MGLRMTEEQYKQLMGRRAALPARMATAVAAEEAVKKRSKYGNQRVEEDGITFDSRHEAAVWRMLKTEMQAGQYKGVARQVAFGLPGGVTYVADFVTLNLDGTYTVMDAKSPATRENAVYKLKKKQMKNCLGLQIKEV